MINVLHIGLTYACNMNCKHCFVKKNKDNLTSVKIKELIDFLDTKGLMMVVYTYGEPLLAKNFEEISKYIKSKKSISQTLMTNGSLLNDNNISILEKNNVKNIMISLDSIDEEKHDNNRNSKGAYKKVIESLEKIDKTKFNVGLAVTVTDENINDLHKIVKLAKNKNLKKISFLVKRVDGKICDLEKQEQYFEFYKETLKNKKYDLNIVFHDYRLISLARNLLNKKIITEEEFEKEVATNSCHNNYTLSMAPNGDLFKCNLSNKSFDNIDSYENMQGFYEGWCNYECINYCSKFCK